MFIFQYHLLIELLERQTHSSRIAVRLGPQAHTIRLGNAKIRKQKFHLNLHIGSRDPGT